MQKKVISALMALFLTVVLFSACSKAEETSSENLKITKDVYYSNMDESAVRAYEKVAAAIINGEGEVKYNLQLSDDVNRLLYTGFPLIELVESMENLSDLSGVSIKYKNDSEKHLELVDSFTKKVFEIMDECGYGTARNNVYLLNVYTYVAKKITYDNEVTNTYDTIMTSKGMSASISSAFEYLLLQGGVEASHLYGKDQGDNYWFFSRAEINGIMYNFDIAAEMERRGGEGLSCFAMTDSEMIDGGLKNEFLHTDSKEADAVKDDKFSALRSCAYYSIEGNTIKAALYSGKTVDVQI